MAALALAVAAGWNRRPSLARAALAALTVVVGVRFSHLVLSSLS